MNSEESSAATVKTELHEHSMEFLIRALLKYGASDLHMRIDRPPLYRIHGKLVAAKMKPFTLRSLEGIITGILSAKQQVDLDRKRNVDVSFQVRGMGRFRCNIFYQRGTLSAAVRLIPYTVPGLDSLELPVTVLRDLASKQKGLMLITGSTGSGKSTTLAAMVQYINETSPVHILCIEDPIEFIYQDAMATITQREVGSDTLSFGSAVIEGLRQDPDVIVIGEMRDLDTIQAALSAAETGHLVISTLHTNDAKSAIERILDAFPSAGQNQIRIQLASTLVGILSQQLVARLDGQGVLPACEVLVKSPIIENYILKNELDRIPDAIAHSNEYYHMQTMNQAVEKLVVGGVISAAEALRVSPNPDDLKMRLSGIDREGGYQT